MAGIGRLLLGWCLAATACLSLGVAPSWAGQADDCRQKGLERLRAASPDGYAIYRQIAVEQPDFFGTWVQCDDAQLLLPTAVHESTHLVTERTDAFPLVGGGAVARPHEISAFYPPARIARAFKADDLVKTYLRRGKASSATDFLFLLDELNAYTHDLNAAVDLKDMTIAGQSVDHRDGLAAMMAFVAVYADKARASEPKTWRGLRGPRVAMTVAQLWTRAERVMVASCGIPDFGSADRDYIRRVCAAGPRSAIAEVLGRAPVCPTACLTAPDDQAMGGANASASSPPVAEGLDRTVTSSISTRR